MTVDLKKKIVYFLEYKIDSFTRTELHKYYDIFYFNSDDCYYVHCFLTGFFFPTSEFKSNNIWTILGQEVGLNGKISKIICDDLKTGIITDLTFINAILSNRYSGGHANQIYCQIGLDLTEKGVRSKLEKLIQETV